VPLRFGVILRPQPYRHQEQTVDVLRIPCYELHYTRKQRRRDRTLSTLCNNEHHQGGKCSALIGARKLGGSLAPLISVSKQTVPCARWSCSEIFLIENKQIFPIGSLYIEPNDKTGEDGGYVEPPLPITSITNIRRINNTLEFTFFNADSLVIVIGQGNEIRIIPNDIKLVYKSRKLKMEKIRK
jgi:hypothetical protein